MYCDDCCKQLKNIYEEKIEPNKRCILIGIGVLAVIFIGIRMIKKALK